MVASCKMPEEMLVQILSRLPSKSLMRFRCVHKWWCGQIDNPSFVAKQLSISIHNSLSSSTCILFMRCVFKDNTDSGDVDKQLLSILNLCNDSNGNAHNFQTVSEDLKYVSLRSGLLPGSLYIAGIKKFELLPKSCILERPPREVLEAGDGDGDEYEYESDEEGFRPEWYCVGVGFGYDSKSKDYKVVRVFNWHPFGYKAAEVYTMGTDSWREINCDVGCCIYRDPSFAKYFKGMYYWPAYKDDAQYWNNKVICSFDMGDEVFRMIPFPDSFYETQELGWRRSLQVWKNESIVVFDYDPRCGPQTYFEMWVMDDNCCGGITSSSSCCWTKHLSMSIMGIAAPFAFWKSDELLMHSKDGYVVSYNISTQTYNYLPFHGWDIQALAYVNSIVPVQGVPSIKATS